MTIKREAESEHLPQKTRIAMWNIIGEGLTADCSKLPFGRQRAGRMRRASLKAFERAVREEHEDVVGNP